MERMESQPASLHPLGPSQEIIMQVARKASLVLALGLAASGAMGGEIQGYSVGSPGAGNTSAGFLATARQNIGVVEPGGKVTDGKVIATGAASTAAGLPSQAPQSAGRAPQNGKTGS
jgi:hypothetical protein